MFQLEEEEFYKLNRDKFPEDFNGLLNSYFELRKAFYETLPAFEKTIHQALLPLMFKQFPDFINITSEELKSHLKTINELFAFDIFWKIFKLIEFDKQKIGWEKKYPGMQGWKEFYCKPQEADKAKRSHYYHTTFASDEEWRLFEEEENKKLLAYHLWEQNRQQQFYDIVQPLIFQTFPDVQNIEGDAWVVYAVAVRDNYEDWKSFSERIESIIDYQLPPGSFMWDYKEYLKVLGEKMKLDNNKAIERRKRRVEQEMKL